MRKILSSIFYLPYSTRKGFTLIELVVVIGIFSVMAGVVLAKYRTFDTNAKFANASEDIVLALRQAQVYGVGVKGTGTSFTTPYGVHFDVATANANKIVLFADIDPPAASPGEISGDGKFTLNQDTAIQTITWSKPISIKMLACNSSELLCIESKSSVTFKRPNPDAIITEGDNAVIVKKLEITIDNGVVGDGAKSNIITIRESGQISVQ